MQRIGLWHVKGDRPKKLSASRIDLEEQLEKWIEQDPELLQQGLTIVGRQIAVEGGKLDLLAIDPQGRWVVIEIKRGQVRREALAQALDYASCVATMSGAELQRKVEPYLRARGSTLDDVFEEQSGGTEEPSDGREVAMFVVGTGSAPGLERMVGFLAGRYGMPIDVVSYQVFEVEGGDPIMARQITDVEPTPAVGGRSPLTVEQLCQLADQSGIGHQFRSILEVALQHGLYARPYRKSIMYTPPERHDRMLFTVNALPDRGGLLRVYPGPEAFAEFFPITEAEVADLLGPAKWHQMTADEVQAFVRNLDRLLEGVAERQ